MSLMGPGWNSCQEIQGFDLFSLSYKTERSLDYFQGFSLHEVLNEFVATSERSGVGPGASSQQDRSEPPHLALLHQEERQLFSLMVIGPFLVENHEDADPQFSNYTSEP
uniref:Uncharacterized protein n=1 Tax=Nothobranchius furzeri TaxID=105023 RepID=A0A1A8A9R3_NOTFU